jgi:hypothetical protein
MPALSKTEPTGISTFRLYLLRATYLLITVGLAFMIWPGILSHSDTLPHMNGVVRSLLGAVSLLCALGIRYPLQMLPILFFELVWKLIWVLAFGLPLWSAGNLGADRLETMNECLFGIVLVSLVLPWRYVVARYIKIPGERWGNRAASSTPSSMGSL